MFTGVVNLLTFKWLFSRVVRWEGRRRDLGRQSRNLESWGECYGLLRHPRSQESPIFMRAVTAVTPQTALAGGKKAGKVIGSYPKLSGKCDFFGSAESDRTGSDTIRNH